MPIALLAALAAAAQPSLRSELKPFERLSGHCWAGEIAKGKRDVHCFEPVLGGQHVRDRHRVEGGGGVYEGETLYSWDGSRIVFTYWNSLGGVSRGTMTARNAGFDFEDGSYKGPDGREIRYSTRWRFIGRDSYEVVVSSADNPALDRKSLFRKLPRGTGAASGGS